MLDKTELMHIESKLAERRCLNASIERSVADCATDTLFEYLEQKLPHDPETWLFFEEAKTRAKVGEKQIRGEITERDTKFDVVEQSARSVPLKIENPDKVQEDTHCGADRTQSMNDGSSDMNDPYWHCPHCGHDEHWFDRSFHINEDGTQEGPFYRCRACGLPDETQ